MLKQILKCSCVFAALVLVFSAIGALVDTDGNAATNQTLLGDIDMGVGTLGDLTAYVTNVVDQSKITDGTNTIDAAGNVWEVRILYGDNWSLKTVIGFNEEDVANYWTWPYWDNDGWYIDKGDGGDVYRLSPNESAIVLLYEEGANKAIWDRGVSGVITNYVGKLALTNNIPDVTGKLDGAAAYPAWEDEHLYSPGDIITYKGRIFQAKSETMGEPPEGAYLSLWNEVLLRDLKQDALTLAQTNAINSGVTSDKVETWDGYASQISNKADMVSVTGVVDYAISEFGRTNLVYQITDGTNTIDASGNVFLVETSNFSEWVKTADESGTSFTSLPYWWKENNIEGWYADVSGYGRENLYNNTIDATQIEYGAVPMATVWERTAGLFVKTNYVGKLALTNDIPPAVTVVSPSPNAVVGTAADAKATGTALYTGFTEWEFSGVPSGWEITDITYELGDWGLYYSVEGEPDAISTQGAEDALTLTFAYSSEIHITATRHLVTPTRTSQLENDGPKDGLNVGHPFATTNQIPDIILNPVYGGNGNEFSNWTIITPTNKVITIGLVSGKWIPYTNGVSIINGDYGIADTRQTEIQWQSGQTTINEVITATRITNSIMGYTLGTQTNKILRSTQPLLGNTYDFSKNYDIIKATADIITLLGGTVTNNPTASIGGN